MLIIHLWLVTRIHCNLKQFLLAKDCSLVALDVYFAAPGFGFNPTALRSFARMRRNWKGKRVFCFKKKLSSHIRELIVLLLEIFFYFLKITNFCSVWETISRTIFYNNWLWLFVYCKWKFFVLLLIFAISRRQSIDYFYYLACDVTSALAKIMTTFSSFVDDYFSRFIMYM